MERILRDHDGNVVTCPHEIETFTSYAEEWAYQLEDPGVRVEILDWSWYDETGELVHGTSILVIVTESEYTPAPFVIAELTI